METVFFNFFRHSFKWKQSFDQLKSYFSTNPSFWLVKTVFWLITNLLLWFRAFLCSWTPLLKLNVDLVLNKNIIPARWNHFLWFLLISWHQISFSWIPAGGSSYLRLVETEFPSNPSSRLVYTGFCLISNHVLFYFFSAAGKHYWN